MTLEAALITAIGAVTGALCFIANLLWARSVKCEEDRVAMRLELEQLKEAKGLAQGTLISYQRCPHDACPFRAEAVRD